MCLFNEQRARTVTFPTCLVLSAEWGVLRGGGNKKTRDAWGSRLEMRVGWKPAKATSSWHHIPQGHTDVQSRPCSALQAAAEVIVFMPSYGPAGLTML